MAKNKWTLEGALILIHLLFPKLKLVNWGVGLLGSVLEKGLSNNDLDLCFYPLRSDRPFCLDELKQTFEEIGMKFCLSSDFIKQQWALKESFDTKHVEVWKYHQLRIDVFIFNGEK